MVSFIYDLFLYNLKEYFVKNPRKNNTNCLNRSFNKMLHLILRIINDDFRTHNRISVRNGKITFPFSIKKILFIITVHFILKKNQWRKNSLVINIEKFKSINHQLLEKIQWTESIRTIDYLIHLLHNAHLARFG